MGTWSKNKVNPSSLNSGNEYASGDNLSVESLNAIVNSGLYSQDFAEHLADTPDTSEAGNIGTPSVELIDNVVDNKTYKKFKFKNLRMQTTNAPVVQTSGQSTTDVMSQKAVTDLVDGVGGVTSVAGLTGAVTASQLVSSILTGASSYGDKLITATDGCFRFASGLMIQWGIYDNASASYDYSFSKTFDYAFSSTPTMSITPHQVIGTTSDSSNIMGSILVLSTSAFTARVSSKYGTSGGTCRYVHWIAIGMTSNINFGL